MRKLEGDGYPRLQMLLLVVLTGAAGMAASFILLQVGIDAMAARYPLAVACAYAAFLFLLWLWLRTKAEDYLDVEIDLPSPGDWPARAEPVVKGGGGQYGGGGASGRFDASDSLPSPSLPGFEGSGGQSVGETVADAVGAADEGAIPLTVAVLLAALAALLLFAALYIVYLAPALFAELLVDGVLSASLYRRLKGLETRHWLESAVRRTAVPFALTALALAAVGYALQSYAPQAHSIGGVIEHHRTAKDRSAR